MCDLLVCSGPETIGPKGLPDYHTHSSVAREARASSKVLLSMQSSGLRTWATLGNRTPGTAANALATINQNAGLCSENRTSRKLPKTLVTTEKRGVASSILALAIA